MFGFCAFPSAQKYCHVSFYWSVSLWHIKARRLDWMSAKKKQVWKTWRSIVIAADDADDNHSVADEFWSEVFLPILLFLQQQQQQWHSVLWQYKRLGCCCWLHSLAFVFCCCYDMATGLQRTNNGAQKKTLFGRHLLWFVCGVKDEMITHSF